MVSIANTTRQTLPRLPFSDIALTTLGSHYNLSLVFVGDKRAKRINEEQRGKTYTPNVLSFPLDKKEGEIFINLARTKREHKKFGHSFTQHVGYLFIHGTLHLKGYTHGSTMDIKERSLMQRFHLDDQKHRHRS